MKKLFLLIPLILALFFFSCGERPPEKVKLTGVYNGTRMEIGTLAEGEQFANFRGMYARDGMLNLVGAVMTETTMENVIISLDTATGEWSRTELPIESQPNSMAASENGYLFVTSDFDRTTFRETYYLIGADADSVLWEKPLSDFIELPERFFGNVSAAEHEGVWYIAVGETLISLNAEGSVIASDTMAGEIGGMFSADDGLHVWGRGFHTIISGDTLREDAAWRSAMDGVNSLTLGSGYDFYKSSEMGLYGVNVADGTSELVMNWVNSGIASAPNNIAVLSEDVIYCYRSDYAASLSGETGIWRYEKCPEDELPERTVIRVTYSETGRGKIPLAAVQFNQSQAEYFIVCEEYYSADTPYATMAEGIDAMLLDGSIGDIVEFDTLADFEKYGSKGYLADLNPLLTDVIAPEDIFGCVRTACETDGKLYGIPQEFALWTCAAKDGALDAYAVWNTEAFIDAYKKQTAAGKYILANTSRAGIFSYLRDGMLQSFIDFDTGTCSFDSEEFVTLLDFLASLPEENACELEYWNENHYVTDEIFLYETLIGSYSEWAHTAAIYEGKGYDHAGYPSETGSVANLDADKFYSVTASSRVKDGAMKFLAYYLSAECTLDEMRGMRKIPTLKSSMEAWNESEGKMYYYFYFGDIGRTSGNTKPFDESKQEPGMQIFAGDPTVVQGLYDFLDTARVARPVPVDVQAIIDEEMAAFYAGAKTAQETAKLIDNRVGTYLAERK